MAADGQIEIQVKVDGKGIQNLNKDLGQLEGKSAKAGTSVTTLVKSIGLVKVASAAFNVLKSSLDSAISRFDTMQKFPKVMSALGFSAEDSQKSISKLSDGIDGLPTKLDDVVATAQRMTSVTNDIDKSTDATIALNNAFLASGASSDAASRGMDQYIKMLSTGKVNLDSWTTLQETMPLALQKTAEAFKFTGKSAQNDLYAAIKSGQITLDEFQDKLIELGTGTGKLAKLAKENSLGIATSFGNLRNAVSKNVANIITKLDDIIKKSSNKTIAQNIDSLKSAVNNFFSSVIKGMDKLTPVIVGVSNRFGELASAVTPLVTEGGALVPVIYGLAGAFTALKIITTVNKAISNSKELLAAAAWSGKALVITLKSQVTAQAASTAATKADMLMRAAQNGQITIGTALIGMFTGGITISTVATTLMTAAVTALKVAINFLLGPVGLAMLAIGGLVAIGKKLWDHFHKEAKETKVVRGEIESLTASTKKQVDATQQNAKARKSSTEAMKAQQKETSALIEELDAITKKEEASSKEKSRAKEITDKLSEAAGGLALVYDDQNNKLSESTEKITAATEAYGELESAAQAQKNINKMLEERNDNEAKLLEININRERWNDTLKDSTGSTDEARKKLAELDEQEKALKSTQQDLSNEIRSTAQAHEESMQKATAAVESGVFTQSISYEALQGKAKETMDSLREQYQSLSEEVGNAFDKIEQKHTISTGEMIDNLTKNKEAVENWGKNISELAGRYVDQGLLEQLRKMGPEGAAQAKVLVDSSDEELERLNKVYKETGESSLKAMKDGFELGKNGMNDDVAQLIVSQKDTLTQQVQKSDFSQVGSSVAKDVQAGVESGRAAVKEATAGIIADAKSKVESEVKSANFPKIGVAIPESMQKGIDSVKDKPVKSVIEMSQDMLKGSKKALDSHSPSKKFKSIGNDVVSGLTLGVTEKASTATSAVRDLSNAVVSSMSGLAGRLRGVGSNAMLGFNAGLQSTAGAALSTARSTANQIVQVMQAALDIHSPSRVMRDKIGKFIPQGIALGIEADSKTVYSAMDKLSNGLMNSITPEMALGTSRIGLASAGSQIVNNTYNNQRQTDVDKIARILAKTPVKAEVYLDGEKIGDSVDRRFGKTLSRRTYMNGG